MINAKYTLGRNTGNTFQPTPAEQELYRALGANMFGSAVRLEQEHVSFTAPEGGYRAPATNRSIVSVHRYADPI